MPYRSRLPQKVTMHLIDAFRAFEKAGAFKPKCGYTQMAKIFGVGDTQVGGGFRKSCFPRGAEL